VKAIMKGNSEESAKVFDEESEGKGIGFCEERVCEEFARERGKIHVSFQNPMEGFVKS